jgi:hypothetical protein
MGKRYTIEEHERHVEAEEQRKAEEEQARTDRAEKEAARALWTQDGGNASDFEKAWPRLRDERRAEKIKNAD